MEKINTNSERDNSLSGQRLGKTAFDLWRDGRRPFDFEHELSEREKDSAIVRAIGFSIDKELGDRSRIIGFTRSGSRSFENSHDDIVFDKDRSPLSATEQAIILSLANDISSKATGSDDYHYVNTPFKKNSYFYETIMNDSLYEDDMRRTILPIFYGKDPKKILQANIIFALDGVDGFSRTADEKYSDNPLSRVLPAVTRDIDSFRDAVGFIEHKVALFQELDFMTQCYEIFKTSKK